MKIIKGLYKGKKLLTLNTPLLRPSSSFVKETLFNIIEHNYKEFLTNQNFLDIFAGTGAVALEALSRGANSITLVESNYNHGKIIKHNLANLTYNLILKNFLITKNHFFSNKFSLVFLDPPYQDSLMLKSLDHLFNLNILNYPALIITESKKNTLVFPNKFTQHLVKTKIIGIKQLHFFIFT